MHIICRINSQYINASGLLGIASPSGRSYHDLLLGKHLLHEVLIDGLLLLQALGVLLQAVEHLVIQGKAIWQNSPMKTKQLVCLSITNLNSTLMLLGSF